MLFVYVFLVRFSRKVATVTAASSRIAVCFHAPDIRGHVPKCLFRGRIWARITVFRAPQIATIPYKRQLDLFSHFARITIVTNTQTVRHWPRYSLCSHRPHSHALHMTRPRNVHTRRFSLKLVGSYYSVPLLSFPCPFSRLPSAFALPPPRTQLGVCVVSVSVCLSQLSTVAAACGGFAAVGPAGRRYRSTAPQRHGAQQHGGQHQRPSSVTFSAAVEVWTQISVVSATCKTAVLNSPSAL